MRPSKISVAKRNATLLKIMNNASTTMIAIGEVETIHAHNLNVASRIATPS
jgi:hypothetical protein